MLDIKRIKEDPNAGAAVFRTDQDGTLFFRR